MGNRTQSIIKGLTTAYTYDDNDRLIQQGDTTYTYDSQGNQTEVSDGTTTDTYSYNANKQLVVANKAGKALSCTYNPDDLRVNKTVDSLTTNFIVDSNRAYQQVIAELADDGSVNKAYTFGNDLISQTDLSTSDTSYFHYDGQGNTRNLSDTNGLSDSYTFDAFGTLLNMDGITNNDYLYSAI